MFSFIGKIIKFAVFSVAAVVALTVVVMFTTDEEKTTTVAKIEQPVQKIAVVAKTKHAAHNMLMNMPVSKQLAAMSNIIRSADYSCSSATSRKFKMFDSEGHAAHVVACPEGKYMVSIKNDAQGSSSVLTCVFLRRINIKC